MAQPPAYARVFSFTDWTANNPSTPQPGVRLDAEYDAAAVTFAAIRANLALIQRDDGQLANTTVGPDQISPELTIGLRSVTSWAGMTDYIVNDAVWINGIIYRNLEEHTSAAAFATDLAALRWEVVVDIAAIVPEAVNIAIANGEIDVGVDTSNFAALNGANAFSSTNAFAGVATFTAAPVFKASDATTATVYFTAKPTDYGVGKPAVVLKKSATANTWELRVEDSVATAGVLNLVATFRVNGVSVLTSTDLTSINTNIRKAKHLSLAY